MLQKFHRCFLLCGGIAYLIYAVFCVFILDITGWKYIAVLVMGLCMLAVCYLAGMYFVRQTSRELQEVSKIMNKILDEPDQIPPEVYKEGELGEIYTNLYKLVQALKQSNLKEQEEKIFLRDIISDISHQLKTPLASLMVFMDLLYDGRVTDEEKQRKMLQESKNQISRMEWMVLSMLKLARIEAGAIQFENAPCDLQAIVAQAKDSVSYLTDKRNQMIEVSIPDSTMLTCDGDWLAESLINLLKNASDYSNANTVITITCEQNPMYTRIYIKDQGCGIAESDMKHIFERFYRVNKEVNPNSVGIGLSLSKSIIEGMGGKISVRSELTKYTEFILTFVHT